MPDGLDAIAPVSKGLTDQHVHRLPGNSAHFEALPNCVEPSLIPTALAGSKIIMAAGRLVNGKNYDLIIRAFAGLSAEFPDWTLRIYGEGAEEKSLREMAVQLGLTDRVQLMGGSNFMDGEWAKAGIVVSASNVESFGMTLVEAMRMGVPSVAADCNYGPRDIITHGEDGLLVPVGDEAAMREALRSLMGDDELRERMGALAQKNMRRYLPDVVSGQFEELVERLHRRRCLPRKAFWTVDASGTIRVSVHSTGLGPNEPLELVARRNGRAPAEERFPFVPDLIAEQAGDHSALRWTATIPAGEDSLAGGAWDLLISNGDDGGGGGLALKTAGYDERELVHLQPYGEHGVCSRVPRMNDNGTITILCRIAPVWAELDHVSPEPDGFTVRVRVYGRSPSSSDQLALVRRGAQDETHYVALNMRQDGAFEARVPYADILADSSESIGIWDAYLQMDTDDVARIRIAQVAGDHSNKRRVYNYPFAELSEERLARPYFTGGGTLCVDIRKA
ncbi:glycosyltransferase [Streptomyces fractus]|uniref:glycosyltransferase n=1 Tax=Streptomyces fractus TaxID=641806 RepID=UPI003CF76E35